MRCTVLGGGGFIGSHLTETLLDLGHDVVVLDRPQSPYLQLVHETGAKVIKGDFLNLYDLRSALVDADVLFHLISTTVPQTATNDPLFDLETNLLGTVKLLQEARDAGVKKIIFPSSGGTVYGVPQNIPIKENHPTDPINAYGIHKLAVEKYLHLFWTLYGVEYCIVRIANAYGERQPLKETQGVILAFINKILDDAPLKVWGDGSVTRDYIHVSDVVDALVKAMSYQEPIGIFNVGSGRGYSLNEVIAAIEKVLGKSALVEYTSGRAFDVASNILDISHAKQKLHWKPQFDLDEGIRRISNWLVAQYK